MDRNSALSQKKFKKSLPKERGPWGEGDKEVLIIAFFWSGRARGGGWRHRGDEFPSWGGAILMDSKGAKRQPLRVGKREQPQCGS